MLAGRFLVVNRLDALPSVPATVVSGHGFVFEIDCQSLVIGFGGDRFTNEPWRDGVGIAVKVDGEIGVYLGCGGISAIRQEFRQGRHGFWFKAVTGEIAGGTVHPYVGNGMTPVIGLGLDIIEVTKRS